jgi:hypothetical protein
MQIRPLARAQTVCALLGSLVSLTVCSGQTERESQLTIPVKRADTRAETGAPGGAGQGCPAGENFERGGYTVTSSAVDNPFDFLPWVHAKDEAAQQKIAALVDRQPFRYSTAVTSALDIINEQDFFPNAPLVKIRVRVELVVVRCSGKDLSLVYHVYSSQITPSMAGTPEALAAQTHSPQQTAGLADDTTPFRLSPVVGYDPTDKVYAGGRFNIDLCHSCKFKLQGMAEGLGSQQMRSVHVAIKGSRDRVGLIAHSEYLVNYNDSSLPTGSGELRNAAASLQYSAITRSFLQGNVKARFGGLLEKGDQQAALRIPLPQTALTATAVNALKLYGGLDSRLSHNVLSASFGLELGTADVTSGVQWKKYLGDVRHEFWHNLGDISSVDLDSRLTLGALQGGPIPISERFFGGNYEQFFMPGETWQIRSNPVIRAIPGSRFYESAAGPGGDRFLSYNGTAAFAVWRKPVVPAVVRKEPTFMTLLNGQIASATSVEQLHFLTLDPHYLSILKESLPEVLQALKDLAAAATAAQHAHPETAVTKFQSCLSAVKMATGRAGKAQQAKDASQYGYVATLLKPSTDPHRAGGDPDEDRLTKVVTRCDDLISAVGTASGIELAPLRAVQDKLEMEFSLVDQTAAEKKAKSDMSFVRRTLNTLFHEANLISVGPVAILDVARIGPAAPGLGGTRYGPGGGVRLELASSVNFTAGYARNLSPGPGEGSGAIFFSIGTRDLFH